MRRGAETWASQLAIALGSGRLTPVVSWHLDDLLRWIARPDAPEVAPLSAALQVGRIDPVEARQTALRLLDELLFADSSDDGAAALALGADASPEALRSRYRLLIRVYHPDHAGDGGPWRHERAERINRAYSSARASQHAEPAVGAERPSSPGASTLRGSPASARAHVFASPAQRPWLFERRPRASARSRRRRRAVFLERTASGPPSAALPQASRVSARVRKVQAIGIGVLLVVTPLALGGVPDGMRAATIASIALLSASEGVTRALLGQRPDRRERGWLAVWIALMAIVVLQLAPLPEALAERLGAYPAALRERMDVRRISPMPLETIAYAATFSAYWAAAWMVARFGRAQTTALAWALAVAVLFEALYGLYAASNDADTILGLWPRVHYRGDATGTFVNRNHFAGLLAAAWPFCLAAILPARGSVTRGAGAALRPACAIVLSVAVGAALVGSHSRLGLLCGVIGIAAWSLLERRSAAQLGRMHRILACALPAAALVGGVWFGVAHTVARLRELPTHVDRLELWRATLELPASAWILGAGAGAYADVFKTVQPASLRPSYSSAHCDWLELAVGMGGVGVAALALAAGFWWRRVRPPRWSRLQRGAFAGIVAIGVHSTADFDLQIPGVALAFWTLVGVVANPGLGRPRGPSPAAWRGTQCDPTESARP